MVARRIIAICTATILLICSVSAFAGSSRIVTDLSGREVHLPSTVKRIVPLGSSLRMVVYLQALDLVVGIEGAETRLPASSNRPYNLVLRQKGKLPPVVSEGWQKPINVEAIMAVRPDLIVTVGQDRSQADDLSRKTGLPVLVVSYGSTGVLHSETFFRSLSVLGSALGREKRANELTGFITANLKELDRRSNKQAPAPAVYVGGISMRGAHGITSSDTDYFPLEAVHGNNIARKTGKRGHLFLDPEQLLVWNPPIIVMDAGGLALLKEDYARRPAFYHRLSAVQKGKVYLTPPYNAYYTNAEIALAHAWFLGTLLYPHQFKGIEPSRKADEILRFFNGTSCYDQLRHEFGGYSRLSFTQGGIRVD